MSEQEFWAKKKGRELLETLATVGWNTDLLLAEENPQNYNTKDLRDNLLDALKALKVLSKGEVD